MTSKYYKYTLSLIPLLFLTFNLLANESETVAKTSEAGILDWAMHNIIALLVAAVIVMAIGTLFYFNNMLLQLQKIRLLQEHGIEVIEEVKLMSKEPWWKGFYKKLTNAVPIEKEEEVMTDHSYDGIRELDNVLPPWWVAMFYGCIVYAVFYFGYYHVFDYGLSSREEYEVAMKDAEVAIKAHLASQTDLVDETNVEMLADETEIAIGQSIFQTQCTPCHGQVGEGNSIGPNLTDEYWLHGGDIKDVFRTIKYGVPEKGMISWKAQLRASDMQRVASYILSLQGTNPPNAKAPQGDRWEATMQKDSSATIGMNQQ
ncbi:MAG: hypothetical protein DHS20C18_18770 [Saprospiraceae bacterium]|nr:MAG: hypothetical protein DHS20C18_18770 [Saprospiraceae bacterium]